MNERAALLGIENETPLEQRQPRRGLALLVVTLFLLASGLMGYFLGRTAEGGIANAFNFSGATAQSAGKPVNILVLGVDERPDDGGRSDTMILLHLDPARESVRLLSIPRDTRVKIPGYGVDKINAAYAYGGERLALQVVQNWLGIPVDAYVKVNLRGFRAIVDRLGGVQIDVEKPMVYDDPYQNLHIRLKAGPQRLNGEQAMHYVRFRNDPEGDIGRVQRQQKFIKALADQALSIATVAKLPGLVGDLRANVTTNLPVADQVQVAQALYSAYRKGLAMQTVPGVPQYIGGVSYWVADTPALEKIVQDFAE